MFHRLAARTLGLAALAALMLPALPLAAQAQTANELSLIHI